MELSQAISLIQSKHILKNEKQTWADLGCGSGVFTNALAHLLKDDSKIFAVDKNASALKNLPEFHSVSIEKMEADFITEELNIEKLDGILMANSLHYVKDKLSFIKNIERHFKGKGRFLIVEYDAVNANPWVPYPVSFDYLKNLFKEAGYTFIDKISEAASRFNRARIYSAFISK